MRHTLPVSHIRTLKEGRFSWKGREYPMEIHGFAHTSVWRAEQQRSDRLVLSLEHNAQTWSQYPFAFRMELTFQVREGSLIIHPRLRNQGQEPMPFQYGFHPYFLTPNPESVRVRPMPTSSWMVRVNSPAPLARARGESCWQRAQERQAGLSWAWRGLPWWIWETGK